VAGWLDCWLGVCVGTRALRHTQAHTSTQAHKHTRHTPTHHAHTLTESLTIYTPHRELKGIKEYLQSDRRVPLTEKELGKGSTEYKYIAPLSSAALAEVDTAKTKPEL
jgi:hypothetical protein